MNTPQPAIPAIPYRRKLNGYRASHRNKWLLIEAKILTPQALILYEFYIDIFDFDYKHEAYRTFTVKFKDIAKIFDCSENTIRNWHKELVKTGLIRRTSERERFELINCERYLLSGIVTARDYYKSEHLQPAENILQSMSKNPQQNATNSQPVEVDNNNSLKDNHSIPIGSYKDEYGVPSSKSSSIEDDIPWINANLREE